MYANDGQDAQHLASQNGCFDFTDHALLSRMRFVTLNEDYVHSKAANVFLSRTVDSSQLIEVSDVGAMRAIIASGVAVGLMAQLAVPKDSRFSFLPVAGDLLPSFDVYAFNDTVRSHGHQRADGSQIFFDIMRQ